MTFKFDHLVHVTHHPEETVKHMQELGFHALDGGRHQNWGTYNGLCHFDLSYIEWLGFENLEIAKQVHDNALIEQLVEETSLGEGFSRIALRTTNMAQSVTDFKSKGLRVHGPVEGSRTRNDGTTLEWSMLFIEDPSSADRFGLPFIIDWKQSDHNRCLDLVKQGIINDHSIGNAPLKYVAVAVQDLEKSLANWKRWFGFTSSLLFKDETIQAQCAEIELEGTNLLFCSPIGEGTVSTVLRDRGQRPFLAAVSNTAINERTVVNGGCYQLTR